MHGGHAVFAQRGEVGGGRIAFVDGEAVMRILFVQLQHQFVARGFRQDRSGGNCGDLAVPFYYRLAGNAGLRAIQAIYQHLLRLDMQCQHGTAHCQQGGLKDVEPVYFADLGIGHRPCQRTLADDGRKFVALPFGEFFRIRQAFDRISLIKDDSGGAYRPGQRAAPGFIYAAYQDN